MYIMNGKVKGGKVSILHWKLMCWHHYCDKLCIYQSIPRVTTKKDMIHSKTLIHCILETN